MGTKTIKLLSSGLEDNTLLVKEYSPNMGTKTCTSYLSQKGSSSGGRIFPKHGDENALMISNASQFRNACERIFPKHGDENSYLAVLVGVYTVLLM